MQRVIIDNTDIWQIESHGNGLAYLITHKPDLRDAFLQGEDASIWRENYESVQQSYKNPESVWHKRKWNDCLSLVCSDYIQEK